MKNILIGFLIAACIFLMIGTTQEMFVTNSDNGKYQGFAGGNSDRIYMINTKTGELYNKTVFKHKKPWVKLSGTLD